MMGPVIVDLCVVFSARWCHNQMLQISLAHCYAGGGRNSKAKMKTDLYAECKTYVFGKTLVR